MLSIWHASIIEISWTLFGLIGVYFGVKNIKESRRDIKALRSMNGHTFGKYQSMKILAFGHYRNDLFRLAQYLIITMIGLLACIFPPTLSKAVGLVVTGGLFTIVLLLIMSSILDHRQRELMETMNDY